MAAYGLRGEQPEEPSEQTRRYWARGKQIGAYMAERFIERYGADDVTLEKPIPWAAGIAHADIHVRSQRLTVEVKSQADPTPRDDQLLQLAGQVVFDPDADRGALIIVDPSSLYERVIPMDAVPERLEERAHQAAAEVAAAADPSAPLPDRVCDRPSDTHARTCPFATVCFHDWQPPPRQLLHGAVSTLVDELSHIEHDLAQHRAAIRDLERERDGIRSDLRRVIEPEHEYDTGTVAVRVTEVKGRVTWDIKTALATGSLDEDELAPWRKQGDPWERWKITPIGDEAVDVHPLPPEDYGDEPPF
jgi:hypothetical protein